MNKKHLYTALGVLWSVSAVANDTPLGSGYAVPSIQEIRYYNPEPIRYTANEKKSVKQAKRQLARPVNPTAGDGGAVTFTYGAATPTIVCAPLRICDMALQPGERVQTVLLGDTTRWKVTPAVSGRGEREQVHAVIKVEDTGLATSLIVTTDRRSYHVNLKSARNDYMPYIKFRYPGDAGAAWGTLIAQQQMQSTAPQHSGVDHSAYAISANDLNFDYRVTGDTRWKPTRVYDDGIKTYIDLPTSVPVGEAPVLLVRDKSGTTIANYRLKDNRYTVDGLVREVHLIQGVGKHQERIIIQRKS